MTRNKSIFLLAGSLAAMLLVFCSSFTSATLHSACSISRIAYVPSNGDAETEAIVIDHSHLYGAPDKAASSVQQYRLRGLPRNFSITGYVQPAVKTTPVDAASLTAPPRYVAPHCIYPQHNYLFRLTPF